MGVHHFASSRVVADHVSELSPSHAICPASAGSVETRFGRGVRGGRHGGPGHAQIGFQPSCLGIRSFRQVMDRLVKGLLGAGTMKDRIDATTLITVLAFVCMGSLSSAQGGPYFVSQERLGMRPLWGWYIPMDFDSDGDPDFVVTPSPDPPTHLCFTQWPRFEMRGAC